jgi:hypothetical protein
VVTSEPNSVLVEWLDSSEAHGWVRAGNFRSEPLNCLTLGILVSENEESVTVASTVADHGGDDEQWSSPMTIPRRSIVRLTLFDWPKVDP